MECKESVSSMYKVKVGEKERRMLQERIKRVGDGAKGTLVYRSRE